MMERLVIDDITHWARTYKVWPCPADSPHRFIFLNSVKYTADMSAGAKQS